MNIIENAIKYVEDLFKNEYSGHDFFHTLRVYKLAKTIALKENANSFIVELASLLHDVDDVKISPNTHQNKDNARKFLIDNDVDNKTVELIVEIIDQVSFKGTDTVIPKTIEGKCVQDADRLDAIGAIGIARTFQFGGSHNRVMYDPNILPKLEMTETEYRNHVSTTVNHFYEKLFKLKDMMNTKTAMNIAIERHNFMKEYIDRFIDEFNGLK